MSRYVCPDCETSGICEEHPAPVRTVDLTPKWRGLVPYLVAAIENGTARGRALAIEELYRLADFADAANAREEGK